MNKEVSRTLAFSQSKSHCCINYSLLLDEPQMRIAAPGGILGDEMGLGKTVEVLGCMLHHPRGELQLPDPLPVKEGNTHVVDAFEI